MGDASSHDYALEGLTRRYAAHAAAIRYEDLPADVVEKAKLLMRDSVGNQLAASATSEAARMVIALAGEWGGAPQATVLGHGLHLPAPTAAMCNAMQAHGVELDDAHGTGLLKGGSIFVPSILAAAELSGRSGTQVPGKEIIAALVAAYDIAVRIAKAINPGHRQRGYHTSGTVSTFGAAAATVKVLGGDAERVAWALGLAGMQAAGIQSYLDDPCMAKPLSPGKSAFNGVLSGVLAMRGFTGPTKVLEGREGFLNAYAADLDVDALISGLGERFSVMEVGFKPHAACRYAHGPIDLAQTMYREDSVRLPDVTDIEVRMSELAIRQASKPECANLNVAMGSTEFGVALALARGGNGLRDYWEGFSDRDVHDALRRVRLVAEPDFGLTGRQAALRVALADGSRRERSSREPKGEPTNPLTREELDAKFLSTADLVVDHPQAERAGCAVMDLESGSVDSIVRWAVVNGGKPRLRAA